MTKNIRRAAVGTFLLASSVLAWGVTAAAAMPMTASH